MDKNFEELVCLMIREEKLTPDKIRTFLELARSIGRASAFLEMDVRRFCKLPQAVPAGLN